MRRALSLALIGLGAFAIMLGLMLQLYAYPRLAKSPLDEKTTSYASGTAQDMLIVLDGGKDVRVHHNVPLRSTMNVRGNLIAPDAKRDGDIAVWYENAQVVDDTGHVVDAYYRQVCLDRSTSAGVRGCGPDEQFIASQKDQQRRDIVIRTPQDGQSFKFPFDTRKQSYQFYDTTLRRPTEARFDGEDAIDGVDVYRFVQTIPDTRFTQEKVPGSLVGLPRQQSVLVDRFYRNTRTLWIEPDSGIVVKGQEQQHQDLRVPGSAVPPTAIVNATLVFTDDTIKSNVDRAKDASGQLSLISSTGPLVLYIAGAVLLIGGVLLAVWQPRRRGKRAADPDHPRELAESSSTSS